MTVIFTSTLRIVILARRGTELRRIIARQGTAGCRVIGLMGRRGTAGCRVIGVIGRRGAAGRWIAAHRHGGQLYEEIPAV